MIHDEKELLFENNIRDKNGEKLVKHFHTVSKVIDERDINNCSEEQKRVVEEAKQFRY